MTSNIHLSTAQVPQYLMVFQEQTLFWLESFDIDFSVSFKEFWRVLNERVLNERFFCPDTQFRKPLCSSTT